jgi:predicted acyl esterase
MDEPAVTVFVEGTRERVEGDYWPPKEVRYESLYLHPRRGLSFELEPWARSTPPRTASTRRR